MKRSVWIVCILLLFGILLSGCSQAEPSSSPNDNENKRLKLDIQEDEVTQIDAYYCVVPAQVEKKIINDKKDISMIFKFFSSIEILGEGDSAPLIAGGSSLFFQIELKSGTCTYMCSDNRFKSSQGLDKYINSKESDLQSLWENLSSTAISVSESDLPKI